MFLSIGSTFTSGKVEKSNGKLKKWDENIVFAYALEIDGHTLNKIQNGELNVDEKIQTNKDLKILKVIQNHKIILGKQVKIIKLWTYKTPLLQWQLTSWLMHHLYIILELQVVGKKEKYFCSIEKDGQRIWIMYRHDFQGVRDQSPSKEGITKKRRTSYSHPSPIEVSYFQLQYDYLEFIKFLYENDLNKQEFDFLSANCQKFAKVVEKHLRKQKKNEFE